MRPIHEAMDASAYAFAHGVRHTRTTLRSWQRAPVRVLGSWAAGSAVAAAGLLLAVLVVASLDRGYQQILSLQPPFAVGDLATSCTWCSRATCSCSPCTRWPASPGFIAGSSLPLQAGSHSGVSRWVHEHGGRLAIAFVSAPRPSR